MNVQEQIAQHIAGQPEAKREELQKLHELALQVSPACRQWFDEGVDETGKVVTNPTIGYGFMVIRYANGKTKEFFRIGISANKTGFSVYILGIDDKKFLAGTYGEKIGKASITGYCIKFRTLKDINIDVLAEAMRYAFSLPQ
ncbi:hypothetical protein GCM10023093_01410 [Nemorincola caseinilytica]|uniref:YdhG-like domain-containing protein n=1 Tax=Nemorincola caseinilytica TaxID=2054315 RepID=A0ABP8N1Q2_9BACT